MRPENEKKKKREITVPRKLLAVTFIGTKILSLSDSLFVRDNCDVTKRNETKRNEEKKATK